ncbi:MAG: hypothetical protein WCY29_16980 [Novosphingobium sp.]
MQVETPQGKDDQADVKVEEIPLPPEELWKELDNSTGAGTAAPAIASEKRPPLPAERLKFMRDAQVAIALEYPFERDGVLVETITLRRLTVIEVGEVFDALADNFDFYDIYAAMADQPAAVLRGLIDVDGEKVAEVGYSFLPRRFRVGTGSASES